MDIAFRITNPYIELVSFITKLEEVSNKLIVYEHDASRTHIHGLVLGCKITTDTMKNWIKKCLNVKTYVKTDWSFKTADDGYDKYITYMSKGKFDCKHNKGFEDEYIDQCRKSWIDYPKQRAENTADKPKVWELAQEIYDVFKNRYAQDAFEIIQSRYEAMPEGYMMYKAYLEIAIDVCNKYKQAYEEHYLRRLVSTAMGQHTGGRKELINKILLKEYK